MCPAISYEEETPSKSVVRWEDVNKDPYKLFWKGFLPLGYSLCTYSTSTITLSREQGQQVIVIHSSSYFIYYFNQSIADQVFSRQSLLTKFSRDKVIVDVLYKLFSHERFANAWRSGDFPEIRPGVSKLTGVSAPCSGLNEPILCTNLVVHVLE